MHDALLMGGLERLRNLTRNRQRVVQPQRSACDPQRQILAFDQFHHECASEVSGDRTFLEPVDLSDVRMIQRCEGGRFPLKTGEAIGIARKRVGEDLERDVASQLQIARAVDFAHAAGAERCDDVVRAEARSSGEGHCVLAPWIIYGLSRFRGQFEHVRRAGPVGVSPERTSPWVTQQPFFHARHGVQRQKGRVNQHVAHGERGEVCH